MYKIGIDLGGTNIAAGLVDATGQLVHKASLKVIAGMSADALVKAMYDVTVLVRQPKGIDETQVAYIGIGIPGACDFDKAIVTFTPNLNLSGTNLRTAMAAYTALPIYIDNDANCAALGENSQGAAKHFNSSVTVTLGTGVGAGVVLNKKLVNGNVEIGHITINPEGPVCGCGNKGCLESYASATGLIQAAKLANPAITEAKQVFDHAQAGEAWAISCVNDYVNYLGIGINNIINSYPIQAVILGGGISKQGDALITPLLEVLKKRALGGNFIVRILPATLGNDAGIIGAAELGATLHQAQAQE